MTITLLSYEELQDKPDVLYRNEYSLAPTTTSKEEMKVGMMFTVVEENGQHLYVKCLRVEKDRHGGSHLFEIINHPSEYGGMRIEISPAHARAYLFKRKHSPDQREYLLAKIGYALSCPETDESFILRLHEMVHNHLNIREGEENPDQEWDEIPPANFTII